MLTLDSTTATLDTDTTLDTTLDTLMPTTERDLLMPSLRLRLMPSSIDMVPITLMLTLERGPPMLSPRLMPTTDITDMAPVPTTATAATATVATGDTTMDKSSSRVTKQKLNANITPCKSDFSPFSAPLRRCRKLN